MSDDDLHLGELEAAAHQRVLAMPIEDLGDDAVDAAIASTVYELAPLLPAHDHDAVAARVLHRLRGLGPLEELLQTDGVTDVMVNGPGPVWIEREGRLERLDVELTRDEIDHLIERMVAPIGRRLDRTNPLVDGRLADGSRVHVAAPPVGVGGPYVTIRRFQVRHVELHQVTTPGMAALLRWAVQARSNVLISGGTGSGKTTMLNALAGFVDADERLVTIEDAAELQLNTGHVARLEARPTMVDGPASVTIRELVRNALRMRPDRIIVGEVRGPEAVDMLQAMNTGHDGSLSTVHANGPADALRRLETMVLMDTALSPALVRDLVAGAIDVIVHLERSVDQGRRVAVVAEPVAGAAHVVHTLGTAATGLTELPRRSPRGVAPMLTPAVLDIGGPTT